jgi:hypothetical protein
VSNFDVFLPPRPLTQTRNLSSPALPRTSVEKNSGYSLSPTLAATTTHTRPLQPYKSATGLRDSRKGAFLADMKVGLPNSSLSLTDRISDALHENEALFSKIQNAGNPSSL